MENKFTFLNNNLPEGKISSCLKFCTNHIKCLLVSWCIFGILLVLFSIQLTFVPHYIRHLVKNGIVDAFVFKSKNEGNSAYDTWISNTGSDAVPVWMECRFFNLTNPDEVILGEYPTFVLTPPLVYNEISIKYGVEFSENSSWVNYYTWEYYTLNTEMYDGNLLDPKEPLVLISPVIGAIWYAFEWKTPIYDEIREYNEKEHFFPFWPINYWDIAHLLTLFGKEDLYMKGTAEDLLFNIYGGNYSFTLNFEGIHKTFNFTIPAFGLLGNGSKPYESDFESTHRVINTGYPDHKRLGELYSYGHKSSVDCWKVPYNINPGHDTYYGLWNIQKNDVQLSWVTTLYVNILMDYSYSHKWRDIEIYRYSIQRDPQYSNVSMHAPNEQFFMYGASGVQNITQCGAGLPLFVSFPFFTAADDYASNLKHFNLEDYDGNYVPYIDIEPITGVIFRANKSLQISTMMHSLPISRSTQSPSVWPSSSPTVEPTIEPTNGSVVDDFGKLSMLKDDLMVPLVELCECEQLTDKQTDTFKSSIVESYAVADALQVTGVVCCCFLVVYLMISCYFVGKYRGQQRSKYIINVN